MHGELGTLEILGPIEVVGLHEGLADTGGLAEGATRRDGTLQNGADGHVEQAEEQLQIGGATDLDERRKLMHLQAGLLLLGVANQIGHYCHVVGYILAYRYRYRFAAIVLHRTVEGTGRSAGHIEADADAAAAAVI